MPGTTVSRYLPSCSCGEHIRCPSCGGEGYAEYSTRDMTGIPCPECWKGGEGAARGPGTVFRPRPAVPATVLDIFCGSGTTLLVADRLGRDAIGIDLSSEYCQLAEKRIREDNSLFLEMETETPAPAGSGQGALEF